MRIFLLYTVFFLTAFMGANAQDFDLSVVSTPETCYSNGTISLTVDNTVTGAIVDYVLYKMPNQTTPVAFGIGDSGQLGYPFDFTGLISGDYAVVATQSVGGAPINSVIAEIAVSMNFNSVSPQTTTIEQSFVCGGGSITVTLNQGIAEYYKLLMEQPAGSNTFVEVAGPQGTGETSTTFENLTEGSYRVVIKDATCGNEVVITTFAEGYFLELLLSEVIFCNGEGIVSLQAIGVEPFTYQMIDADGEIIIDNGGNNTFLNVGLGIQTFMVTDGCGYSAILQTIFDESFEENLFFSSQAQINNFSSLNCTQIAGNLTISGQDITDLSGLSNITEIGGNLIIIDCPLLTNLNDFVSLVSIGGAIIGGKLMNSENQMNGGGILQIENNPLLSDISGLVNINPNTISELIIVNNLNLSVCSLSNLCTYLSDTDNLREIGNNAGNCIDEPSVMSVCATMNIDNNELHAVQIYPNPVKELLYFSKEVQKVTITDLTGKVLTVQNNSTQIDMSNFQKGVYLIVIEQENHSKETNKIIKH